MRPACQRSVSPSTMVVSTSSFPSWTATMTTALSTMAATTTPPSRRFHRPRYRSSSVLRSLADENIRLISRRTKIRTRALQEAATMVAETSSAVLATSASMTMVTTTAAAGAATASELAISAVAPLSSSYNAVFELANAMFKIPGANLLMVFFVFCDNVKKNVRFFFFRSTLYFALAKKKKTHFLLSLLYPLSPTTKKKASSETTPSPREPCPGSSSSSSPSLATRPSSSRSSSPHGGPSRSSSPAPSARSPS